jgi:hypothetical protein
MQPTRHVGERSGFYDLDISSICQGISVSTVPDRFDALKWNGVITHALAARFRSTSGTLGLTLANIRRRAVSIVVS